MTTSALSVFDRLPSLPSNIAPGNAALWAATILLKATLERNWPIQDVRSMMFTLAAAHCQNVPDETLHAELTTAVESFRAHAAREDGALQ
jgi:hypothetical protein